jgi:hypothetical protein
MRKSIGNKKIIMSDEGRKEGMLRIFSPEKYPTALAEFESVNSGTRGQHANH